jgi:hypothetical protein
VKGVLPPDKAKERAPMNIRVETKNHEILTIDLSGEWRVEPVDLNCLVGPDIQHFFTADGYYDHAEPRPGVTARKEPNRMDVGPTDGQSCVP